MLSYDINASLMRVLDWMLAIWEFVEKPIPIASVIVLSMLEKMAVNVTQLSSTYDLNLHSIEAFFELTNWSDLES